MRDRPFSLDALALLQSRHFITALRAILGSSLPSLIGSSVLVKYVTLRWMKDRAEGRRVQELSVQNAGRGGGEVDQATAAELLSKNDSNELLKVVLFGDYFHRLTTP